LLWRSIVVVGVRFKRFYVSRQGRQAAKKKKVKKGWLAENRTVKKETQPLGGLASLA
jgi:hypothetical protein